VPINVQGLCPLIQVFDMPTSIRFYRDVLGFEVFSSSPPRSPDDCDWVWLKLNGTELMLNTAYEFDSRPQAPDPARVAAHDDTCLYLGCPDVDAAYRHLRAKGLDLKEPKIASYGMKQLYLHDPDGYNICFQWNAPS
jgi:catechol 2,3-dioxygenase-like lactoylglutathione lyase family enzyme